MLIKHPAAHVHPLTLVVNSDLISTGLTCRSESWMCERMMHLVPFQQHMFTTASDAVVKRIRVRSVPSSRVPRWTQYEALVNNRCDIDVFRPKSCLDVVRPEQAQ